MVKVLSVPITEIRENPVALRNVNRTSETYLGLVDSVKSMGILNAISLRQRKDKDGGKDFYELVDGLHRFSAAKDAGVKEIPATIVDLNEDQILEAQIVANIHKVETRPIEYSKQLQRILARNPMMTETVLATKLGKTGKWISDRLGLNKIANTEITGLIDTGKITLSNAYALAKLPEEERAAMVDRAMTQKPDVFIPAVAQRVKQIKEASRQGKNVAPLEFKAIAHIQKSGAIKDEVGITEGVPGGKIAKVLVTDAGIKDPVAAFNMALSWVLHLDPQSVKSQKADWDAKQKAKAEKAKKIAVEKAEKKKVAAAKKADEAAKAAVAAEEILKK